MQKDQLSLLDTLLEKELPDLPESASHKPSINKLPIVYKSLALHRKQLVEFKDQNNLDQVPNDDEDEEVELSKQINVNGQTIYA